MAEPALIRLQLDAEAKGVLDGICDRRGITQIAALTRLVSWFGRRDQVIQASALGLLSDQALGGLAAVRAARPVRPAKAGAKVSTA